MYIVWSDILKKINIVNNALRQPAIKAFAVVKHHTLAKYFQNLPDEAKVAQFETTFS